MNMDNKKNAYYTNDQDEYQTELLVQLYMLL